MVGIVSYGVYIPKYRIKLEQIASAWHKEPRDILSGLHVSEKAVANLDEDAITMGVEASLAALAMSKISSAEIGSVFVGSESHPYAVNPSSTKIAEYLGIGHDYFAVDLEFACKAATAGLQVTLGLLESGKIDYGLVIGSDTAQAKPHDILEYTSASIGCAYILGRKTTEVIAEVKETLSFSSDTPDFWRRDGIRYPSHFGRFTGEPAYFTHVLSAARNLLAKTKLKPSDFDYCVFHMPNGKFPRVVAKKLGFTDVQLASSLTVDMIGNPYTASSLLGLASVLDIAKPNQSIFLVSYGSGAGSDAFVLTTTKRIGSFQKKIVPVVKKIEDKQYISYLEYLQKTDKL